MKIIKEFKEPTTIIICGAWVEGIKESLKITDDESQIDVRGINGFINMTTLGQAYILTEDEFNWFITSDHYKMYCEGDDFSDIEHLYIPIKDYVGVIGAIGITPDNEMFDNWDINDYFYHQVEDSGVFIDVSGDYNIRSMNVNEVKHFLAGSETNEIVKVGNIYDVEIYKDSKKEWRWKVTADNGNIIGSSSEGYKNKAGLISNIESLGASLSNYKK